MSDIILLKQDRPRAIAKEKDGIVLYWVEELQVAGLSFKGLGRLLQCDDRTVANLLQGTEDVVRFEAETVTDGGIQVLNLISESDLTAVLTTAIASKCKAETRKNAAKALSKLAAAGFKLMVMLELAPHQLKAQVDAHVTEVDKLLEIERLRYKNNELHSAALTMHGSAWLALQGVGMVERETIVTEVLDPVTQKSQAFLSADQLKRAVKQRTGQNIKSAKEFTDALRALGRDDLLVAATRHYTSEYVHPAKLDEAISLVFANRQGLIGE